jgi:hypothetical protein
MNRLILPLALGIAAVAAHAELHAPDRQLQAIADPANVVIDRGSKLEILPNQRATPELDSAGKVVAHQMLRASAATPIGQRQLGVVYNHAMQQQGYISGEIAFKMKAGGTAAGFSAAMYPGLKKITNPDVYVVNARTPAEFLKVLKRLQGRGDVEWVVPTVTYGPVSSGQIIR